MTTLKILADPEARDQIRSGVIKFEGKTYVVREVSNNRILAMGSSFDLHHRTCIKRKKG